MKENGKHEESMVMRVARTIWRSNAPPKAPVWEGLSSSDQYQIELIAEDCILSMRVPTEAMIKAALEKAKPPFEDAGAVWKAMIEAAAYEAE